MADTYKVYSSAHLAPSIPIHAGIAVAGPLLAIVAGNSLLSLFRHNRTVEGTLRGPSSELWSLNLDVPADETMTELRLLDGQEQDDFQLLICFTSFCRLTIIVFLKSDIGNALLRSCPISSINSNEPPSAEQCFTHQMDKPVQAMRAMLSTENNRLFIRPIYSPNSAALVAINPFDGHQLRASDYVHIEDHRVVASFRSGQSV